MKKQNYFILMLAAIALLAVGCSKVGISDKSAMVSGAVFADGTGTVADGGGAGGGSDNPGVTDGSSDPTGASLLCSRERAKQVGYALDTASSLELQIVDKNKNVVCKDDSAGIKDSIVNKKILPLSICSAATGDSYTIRLLDPSKKDTGYDLLNNSGHSAVLVRDKSSGKLVVKPSKVSVLFDDRSNGDLATCDQTASPLVVKMVDDGLAGFSLTSIENGVQFDILGERSTPHAHVKKQISWIKKSSYMFLALPDANGQVNGIDELFGNNTMGPDGQYASDGYEALAKYDLNHDGVIDEKDAIYSKLRLWSDKNKDGVQGAGELISLKDAGITSIDLKYDDKYYEKDKYGNETKMKSVVNLQDGSMRLIFDLWFNYEDILQKK